MPLARDNRMKALLNWASIILRWDVFRPLRLARQVIAFWHGFQRAAVSAPLASRTVLTRYPAASAPVVLSTTTAPITPHSAVARVTATAGHNDDARRPCKFFMRVSS